MLLSKGNLKIYQCPDYYGVIGGDMPLGTIDTLRKPKKKILGNFRHPKSRVSPLKYVWWSQVLWVKVRNNMNCRTNYVIIKPLF